MISKAYIKNILQRDWIKVKKASGRIWDSVKKMTPRQFLSLFTVFVLVALWNILVSNSFPASWLEGDGPFREALRDVRNANLDLQLGVYQWLKNTPPIRLQNSNVTLVYIDDGTWDSLGRSLPVDRAFLANIILQLSLPADTHARVIGIDVPILDQPILPPGPLHDARKASEDRLLDAIHQATQHGVPVILGGAYGFERGSRERAFLTPLFKEVDLAQSYDCDHVRCPSYGFINLPEDKRLIPLALRPNNRSDDTTPEDSFALTVVKADLPPDLAHARFGNFSSGSDALFGSFLPEPEDRSPLPSISHVTALEVLGADLDANGMGQNSAILQKCANKIVIIGPHWHDPLNHGELVDSRISPAGKMSNLVFQADYVESLKQQQTPSEWPLWLGVLIDVVVGLFIVSSFETLAGMKRLLLLSAAFVAPLVLASISMNYFNCYLDFLLPIELYVIHFAMVIVTDWIDPTPKRPAAGGAEPQVLDNSETGVALWDED